MKSVNVNLLALAVVSWTCGCSGSSGSGRVGDGAGTGGLGGVTDGSAFASAGGGGAGGSTASGGAGGNATGVAGAPNGGASNGGDEGDGGVTEPPAACPVTAMLTAGDSTGTIQVGSLLRQYLLHVPASYTGKSVVPLVVDFHPFLNFLPGDPGAYQKANSGYLQVSDQEGFVVVYPEGINSAWNLPNPSGVATCCTQDHGVDDVGFAKLLVAKLKRDACVDPKRVYATGYSNGGGMAHVLACQAADIFAAVAPASFDLIQEAAPCSPSRPITEISFRGLNDPVVPYAGGNPPAPPSTYPLNPVHFLGALATLSAWGQLDGCTGKPGTAPGTGDWDCQTYPSCKAGVEVSLCSGHTANKSDGHVEGDATLGWSTMKRHTLP